MAEVPKIRLAISTCPNDTFAFHALVKGLVDWRGLDFEVELLDISELNQGLWEGKFDICKASFHAAARLADRTVVLPCGAAIGFGVGPLLLAANDHSTPSPENTTLCPGPLTTATMLFRMFYGMAPRVRHVVFSEIMPAVQSSSASFGVCIHEGRFTWREQGLHHVEDLGTRWESVTHLPLPLGGLLARRQLDADVRNRAVDVIRDSIRWGQTHREATLPTMRAHAQELDDDVLFQHVDLYVNDWTIDLGKVGRDALGELSRRAIGLFETSESDRRSSHEITIVDR